jgi:hypothetical protein
MEIISPKFNLERFDLIMNQAGSKRCKINFPEIIFTQCPISRRIARKIELIGRKVINAEAAVSFNKICLEEDILAKYTVINVYMEGNLYI